MDRLQLWTPDDAAGVLPLRAAARAPCRGDPGGGQGAVRGHGGAAHPGHDLRRGGLRADSQLQLPLQLEMGRQAAGECCLVRMKFI